MTRPVATTGPTWRTWSGRAVAVHALAGSYGASRAPAELRDAERAADVLQRLLAPPDDRKAGRTDVYLVDPADAPATDDTQPAARAVAPDQAGEPVAALIARLLVSRWFGPGAASAGAIVRGLGGLAALGGRARATAADDWVRAELEAGRPVRALASGSTASPDGATVYAPAETSFVAYLLAISGPAALRRFLAAHDPARPDAAALAAYQRALPVLEEAWLAAVARRTGAGAAVRALLPRLRPLLAPHKLRWAEIILLVMLAAAANTAAPLATRAVIDHLKAGGRNGAGDWAGIERVLLTLGCVYAASSLVSLRRAWAVSWLNQRILESLQEGMFAHLQYLSHDYYGRSKVGDIMSRLTGDLNNVQSVLSQVTNKALYQVFTVAFGLAALVAVAGAKTQLWAPVLLILPLFSVSYFALRSRNKHASREQRRRVAETAVSLQENLSAHAVVKAFGMEERAIETFRVASRAQRRSAVRLSVLNGLADTSQDLTTRAAELAILAAGGWIIVHHGGVSAGSVTAALMLVKVIFDPIAALAGIGQTIQQASGALERVNELFEEPVTVADEPGAAPLPPAAGEVRLEHVTFGYGGGHVVLHDLSLVVPAGARAAIVGRSGSGKSTVISLLMRFWDPDAGRILVDGVDIRTVTLRSLRGQMGLVFQNTFVFNTTVMENIRLARPEASDAEVVAAARAAHLDADVGDPAKFPAGYGTVLSERGANISGGQAQRLAIARAILRDPRVLLLDEATSALDAKTEAGILDTLQQLTRGRTTIYVTHRISWAAEADVIFVLDRGRLVERGTHAQLVTAGGLYQELYEEQTGFATEGSGRAAVAVEALRAVPLFRSLPDAALVRLAGQVQPMWRAAGVDVVRQGTPNERLYIVEHGEVDVLAYTGAGDRRVNTLADGDFFGEMSLLQGKTCSATVRTVRPTRFLTLAQDDYDALLAREPALRGEIEAAAAARRKALQAVLAGPAFALASGGSRTAQAPILAEPETDG